MAYLEAAGKLAAEGIKTRVVSIPCWLVFDQQPQEYRLSVLRSGAPILSLEALSTAGWAKYSHEQYGIDTFGASGPYKEVYKKFGITGDSAYILILDLVDGKLTPVTCRHRLGGQEGRRVLQAEGRRGCLAPAQGFLISATQLLTDFHTISWRRRSKTSLCIPL